MPSWLNEKQRGVSVNKTVWGACVAGLLMKLLVGLLGGWAYQLTGPDAVSSKADCSNFLLVLDAPGQPLISRTSAYLFTLTTLLPGVPVLAVVIKYNLITSGLCRPRAATWWAVIAPWIITGFLYNTDLFTTVLNWVALIFQGFTNFTLPPLLFLAALRQGHAVGPAVTNDPSGRETELSALLDSEPTPPPGPSATSPAFLPPSHPSVPPTALSPPSAPPSPPSQVPLEPPVPPSTPAPHVSSATIAFDGVDGMRSTGMSTDSHLTESDAHGYSHGRESSGGGESAGPFTHSGDGQGSAALRQEIERMREEEAYCIKARDWLGAERAKEKVAALAAQLGAQLGAQRGPIAACMPAGHTMSDPPPAFALAPADDDEPLVNAVPEWLSQLISAEALAQGMVIVMSVLSLVAIGLGLVAAVS